MTKKDDPKRSLVDALCGRAMGEHEEAALERLHEFERAIEQLPFSEEERERQIRAAAEQFLSNYRLKKKLDEAE